MFGKKEGRTKELTTRVKALEKEKSNLKKDVEELKLKKKIEDEDIKHMVKMKEERLDIEIKKKEKEINQEKETAIGKVKDAYRDKVEKNLEIQKDDIKGMYDEILKRLPNVNVKLKGGA